MTDAEHQRLLAIARTMTTDEIVTLISAHSEAQLYISTLADELNRQSTRADLAETALANLRARQADAVPLAINDEPTISRTATRRGPGRAA